MKLKKYVAVDLRLFDGDGGGGTSSDAGTAAMAGTGTQQEDMKSRKARNPLADVKYGNQPEQKPDAEPKAPAEPKKDAPAVDDEARKAEFEKLISGDYKDLFAQRTQEIIDTRFKQTKQLESQASALNPVLELLAGKYGVDAKDVDALSKAIQEDNSYYEDEAMEKGLTVEQLKYMKKLERDNAEFQRAVQEQQRRVNADQIYAKWQQQADATKQYYPSFDLQKECSNPETGERFVGLLRSGVDVKAAYQVIHMDEVLGGAMAHTAKTIQQKTVNDIRARGMRPAENGMTGGAPAVVIKNDVSKLTRKDRDEIARRSAQGEYIEF